MTAGTTLDDKLWGLPYPVATQPVPKAEQFTTTPLLDLLRQAASRAPDSIALVSRDSRLNYADMLRLACNSASAIAALVPFGRPVACVLPRTPRAVAALLGCLISGRLCMVVNPANPPPRLAALLEDAAPAAVLLEQSSTLPYDAPALTLEAALRGRGTDWRPDYEWDPDAPFAVHFTSGSTGRPKGIVLTARCLLYRGLHSVESIGLTAEDRIFRTSFPIESSGLAVLLAALARGARVVLADIAAEGGGAVLRLLERERITTLSAVPRVLNMLFHLERSRIAFAAMRVLGVGAGALRGADLAVWRDSLPRNCTVLHAYASTEAQYLAQWFVPPNHARDASVLPVGLPQPDNDYVILTEAGVPAAPGETGELVVRGRYLAPGEWQGGKLVEGRMTPVPGRPGWREFRTGDLVRQQADGMLRVVDRVDRQVKINGVRIEPAEIEAVLRAEPLVTDAIVVTSREPNSVTLHGFVVATAADDTALIAALRRRLAASLPSAMRPARLTVVERLPMLPSGKVDLVALTRR